MEEASRFAGISLTYLSDLEHDRTTNPTLSTLRAVSLAYSKSLVEFLLYVDGCNSTTPPDDQSF